MDAKIGTWKYLHSLKVSSHKIFISYKKENSSHSFDQVNKVSLIIKGTEWYHVPSDEPHRGNTTLFLLHFG